jgi:hypothetical protein
MQKSCKDCTKCCEGYLTGNIKGHLMGTDTSDPHKPTPCYFVEINKGCNIYKQRPVDPCRQYECDWIKNKNTPDHFKPSISQTIVTHKKIKNVPYLLLAEAGKDLDEEVLNWYIDYCKKNGLNLAYKIGKEVSLKGTQEFLDLMYKTYKKS